MNKSLKSPSYMILNDNHSVDDNSVEDDYYFYEDIDKLQHSWIHEPHVVPLVIVYGTVFLFGIVGNGMVIFSVIGSRSSRSVTFTFMTSLALADILFLMVVVPHETLRMVLEEWPGGRAFCKVSGFTEMLTAVASILNLTAISFERSLCLADFCGIKRRFEKNNKRHRQELHKKADGSFQPQTRILKLNIEE